MSATTFLVSRETGGFVYLTIVASVVVSQAAVSFLNRARRNRDELATAIDKGDAAAIRRMLEAGTSSNTRSGKGRTILMAAAAAGDLALVKENLWHGADPAAQDAEGQTALSLAEQVGHREVVCALKGIPLQTGDDHASETLPIVVDAPGTYENLPIAADSTRTDRGGIYPLLPLSSSRSERADQP